MEIMTQTNTWQFEGTPEAYEAYLVPLLSLWTDELVEMAGLKLGERVLDVACGTGIVARRVAQQMGKSARITGLDANTGMLSVARKLWDGHLPPIEWREGDAAALPFPDQAFDAAFCQQGLQFFPDRLAALKEIYRVLAPGGCLALSVWRPIRYNVGYQAIADALERRVSPESAHMERGPFMVGYLSEWRNLLENAGFGSIHSRIAIRSVRFTSPEELLRQEVVSWLAGVTGEIPQATRMALIGDLNVALENYLDDNGLTFPMETYLVRANK